MAELSVSLWNSVIGPSLAHEGHRSIEIKDGLAQIGHAAHYEERPLGL
jgi:hypothetical protein